MVYRLFFADRDWRLMVGIPLAIFFGFVTLNGNDLSFETNIFLSLAIAVVVYIALRVMIEFQDSGSRVDAEQDNKEKSKARTYLNSWAVKTFGFPLGAELWREGPNWVAEFSVENKHYRVLVHHDEVYVRSGDFS